MSLKDAITKGKGKAGHWQVTQVDTDHGKVCTLWHYSTDMLTWLHESPTNSIWHDFDIGNGSKSDQQGLNKAFRILNMPYYFSRDRAGGGPRIDYNPVEPLQTRDAA